MKTLIRMLTLAACWVVVGAVPALAGQAQVLSADDNTIKIGAGVDRGVRVGMLAEIYRQAAPLIHPVTGEDLGSPKVKIARIEITSVGAVSSEGRFVENYAPVEAGDVIESIEVAPTEEDQIRASIAVTQIRFKEIADGLASEIKNNQKAITDLRATLRRIGSSEQRLRAIANDVANMRERMVTIESRIGELETGQMQMIMQDSAEAFSVSDDMTQLQVLRRDDSEEIHLLIGDRTFRLSFEDNALTEVIPGQAMGEMDMEGGVQDLLDPLPEEEEEAPWYMVYWWIAPVIGVLGAAAVIALRFLKRPAPEAEEAAGADEEGGGEILAVDDGGFPEAEDGLDEIEDFEEEIPEPEKLEPAETEE